MVNFPSIGAEVKGLSQMQILERLRQLFFYSIAEKAKEKEKRPEKWGKKEYDKKGIVKILVFENVFCCEESS